MSITAILMLVIAGISALLGGVLGHKTGKSAGVSEGIQKQAETQQAEQTQAIVKAAQERSHVDQVVSNDSDDELDARLSKYDRKD